MEREELLSARFPGMAAPARFIRASRAERLMSPPSDGAQGKARFLPEALRFLQDYRFIIYGILLVVMMRVRPQGLLGWKSPLPYKMPKQPGKE